MKDKVQLSELGKKYIEANHKENIVTMSDKPNTQEWDKLREEFLLKFTTWRMDEYEDTAKMNEHIFPLELFRWFKSRLSSQGSDSVMYREKVMEALKSLNIVMDQGCYTSKLTPQEWDNFVGNLTDLFTPPETQPVSVSEDDIVEAFFNWADIMEKQKKPYGAGTSWNAACEWIQSKLSTTQPTKIDEGELRELLIEMDLENYNVDEIAKAIAKLINKQEEDE